MNRTFLIFLMIASAMLIAVIGTQKPTMQLDYTPWDAMLSKSGSVKAFGVTLGETTVKESETVLGKTPETQLVILTNDTTDQQYELVAIYKDLIISGVISELRLTYQLEPNALLALYSTLHTKAIAQQSYSLSPELAAPYLSSPITRLTYIPSINYGEDIIIQRFGTAEYVTGDMGKKWLYPEIGLEIQFHTDQAERFIYTNSK